MQAMHLVLSETDYEVTMNFVYDWIYAVFYNYICFATRVSQYSFADIFELQ